MAEFIYRSRDAQGQLQEGLVEAANVREATRQLIERKHTVISIHERGKPGGAGGFMLLLLVLAAAAAAAYFWTL